MSSEQHRATEDDLNQHGLRLVNAAYRDRGRTKCSREDFGEGYTAALVDMARWMFFETRPDLLKQRTIGDVIADDE